MSRTHAVTAGCLLAVAVLTPAVAPATVRSRAAQVPAVPAAPAVWRPPSGMLEALQRDLGLTAEQARARLLNEIRLAPVETRLRRRLGANFGGSWLRGKTADTLVMATTSTADIPPLAAAGVQAELVGASLAQLTKTKRRLDGAMASHAHGGTVRYIDVRANKIVVLTPGIAATRNLLRSVGMDTDKVVVVASPERPRPLYDLKGGDPYYIGVTNRCSVGFAAIEATGRAERGFVSAGHCGKRGSTTSGFNRSPQGVIEGSSFPGDDYSWITVNRDWTIRPAVDNGASGTLPVAGARVAAVGASVCRSGSTTDFHCGTVQQRDVSVTYPQGVVFGLTRTDVCAEPGDSGGPFIAVDQAQGVTSGGSGDCGRGGITYFQPVGEILTAYDLTLVTTAMPAPPLGSGACGGFPNSYAATLRTGRSAYRPRTPSLRSAAGTRSACLEGPEGTDFDLYLERWNGTFWSTVATSAGPTSSEKLTHTGASGLYRYRVTSAAGSGRFVLGYRAP